MVSNLSLLLGAALLVKVQPVREGMPLSEVPKNLGQAEVRSEGQKKIHTWFMGGWLYSAELAPSERLVGVRGKPLSGSPTMSYPSYPEETMPFEGAFNFKDLFGDLLKQSLIGDLAMDHPQRLLLADWISGRGSAQEIRSDTLRLWHEVLRQDIVFDNDSEGLSRRRLMAVEAVLRARALAQRPK